MNTSPTGSVEELEQIEKDMAASFESFRTTPPETYFSATPAVSTMAASSFIKRIQHYFRYYKSPSEMASEVRKSRPLPKPIKSTSDIRCGNSRPLKEREIVMKAYNKCLRDVAELEREEQ